jgi:selenocysteine lyase/cysteine desulfurase
MTYEEARAQFPVLERYAYLNAGTNGPLARVTVDALAAQAQRDLVDGRFGPMYFERMLALRETARDAFAAVLGVESDRMALVDSTSRGCAIVLAGLGLSGEDEVITTDQEHFGLTGPLYATGARVVIVEAEEDAILAAITPRTRLIATSHILWTTGRRFDLHRVKEESGLPLLVDGAQSAGAIPVDVGELDFYTVSAQKWLCAPDPTGALYVRDPATVRVKTPSYFSQDSYELSGEFVPKATSARFDAGWIGLPTLAGLVAALGTHPEWRYERAAEMAARCRELLEPYVEVVTPPGHSTLVSFRPNGDPVELIAQLYEAGVVVRELPGRNLVRASCGWWTNEDDLQRLAAGLGG